MKAVPSPLMRGKKCAICFFYCRGITVALSSARTETSRLLLEWVSMAEAVPGPTSLASSSMCPTTRSGSTRSSDITPTLWLCSTTPQRTHQNQGTNSNQKPLLWEKPGFSVVQAYKAHISIGDWSEDRGMDCLYYPYHRHRKWTADAANDERNFSLSLKKQSKCMLLSISMVFSW